jgi:hypothetical protein
VFGVWCLGFGVWCLVFGVCGLVFVVCGLWRLALEQSASKIKYYSNEQNIRSGGIFTLNP